MQRLSGALEELREADRVLRTLKPGEPLGD
jgi:hypothetical protein